MGPNKSPIQERPQSAIIHDGFLALLGDVKVVPAGIQHSRSRSARVGDQVVKASQILWTDRGGDRSSHNVFTLDLPIDDSDSPKRFHFSAELDRKLTVDGRPAKPEDWQELESMLRVAEPMVEEKSEAS